MQRIIKASTETLYTYPPILAQASGTPTARIGTASTPMPDAGSNCTVDTLSTDVAADAYEGSTQLTVTSATWVKGRKYIATSSTGEVFPIVSDTDGASDTLNLQEPIPSALLTGSTIKGYRISITLTADQTSDIGKAAVEWAATLNSVSEKWTDTFYVVERDGGYSLDAEKLSRYSAFCRRVRPDSDNDMSETIDAAWVRYIRPSLLAKGVRPELFISRDELESVHIAACEHHVAQQATDVAQDVREEKRRNFSEAMSLVLQSDSLWVIDDTEVIAEPAVNPARRDVAMVTR